MQGVTQCERDREDSKRTGIKKPERLAFKFSKIIDDRKERSQKRVP